LTFARVELRFVQQQLALRRGKNTTKKNTPNKTQRSAIKIVKQLQNAGIERGETITDDPE